jgi:dienelactone hydrolase
MAEVLLFHHVQGRTTGVVDLAADLEAAGHTVHVPDLFDGHTFVTLDEGIAYAESIGFDAVVARAAEVADAMTEELVYVGISMGVMPAQMLAQTRPGARAAVLLESCVPVREFGDRWPEDVPVQVHLMEHDPFFAGEGDIEAARELVAAVADATLFLYPGDHHLFVDPSLPSYDATQAALVVQRMLELLERC